MLNFVVNGSQADYVFNLPESLDEITKEYLETITSHVKIADHYSLIGIVYHESIAALSLIRAQKKNKLTTGIIPIFIKAGNTDSEFVNSINIKEKLLIGSSALEQGYRVTVPGNDLNMDKFISCLDLDKETYAKARVIQKHAFFIDFKLIPNNEIKAVYSNDIKSEENKYLVIHYKNSAIN